MKSKKTFWTEIIRIAVQTIIAVAAAFGVTSCMQVNKSTDTTEDTRPVYQQPIEQPQKTY